MSQATPYERKYDLTNDDGQDLRTQLDIELDDVARCFLETLTNLALIQRDDGQLANKSVGVEQLKAELIAGFNPPEPFQPFRLYEVSDSFVTDDGKWYIVNTAFVADSTVTPNLEDVTLVYDFASVRDDSIAAKDAAEAAQAAAELARDQAQTARSGAETAQTAAEQAEADATAVVQDVMVSRGIYATTAQGLANTEGSGGTNRYFSVPSSSDEDYLDLYRNEAGAGAAVLVKQYPSSVAVDRRAITFGAVADMQAFPGLKTEQKVRTLGYYAPGDGGGNDYEIVAADTGTDDGGSFIDLSASGLQAKGLFVDGVISLRRFGALGDGVADDTPARDAMYGYWLTFDIEKKPKLHAGPGKFRFTAKFTTGEEGFVLIGAGGSSPFVSISTLRGGTQFIYDGLELADTEGFFEFGVTQQCRGAYVEGITFICNGLANAIWLESCSKSAFIGNTFADTKHGVVASSNNNNNLIIERNVFYRPSTGYGGVDLRENAHAASVIKNAFINDPDGIDSPDFAVRIAETGNCSAVSVDDNSFDFYRVTTSHFLILNETKGGQFCGNYIECRGDGVTAGAVNIAGGAGLMISGNRLTASDSPTVTTVSYGVNVQSTARSVSIVGNYFSGFDVACVRVAAGAMNIFIAGNDRGSLPLFVDQSAAGSKAVCAIDNGAITATDYITSN